MEEFKEQDPEEYEKYQQDYKSQIEEMAESGA